MLGPEGGRSPFLAALMAALWTSRERASELFQKAYLAHSLTARHMCGPSEEEISDDVVRPQNPLVGVEVEISRRLCGADRP